MEALLNQINLSAVAYHLQQGMCGYHRQRVGMLSLSWFLNICPRVYTARVDLRTWICAAGVHIALNM